MANNINNIEIEIRSNGYGFDQSQMKPNKKNPDSIIPPEFRKIKPKVKKPKVKKPKAKPNK